MDPADDPIAEESVDATILEAVQDREGEPSVDVDTPPVSVDDSGDQDEAPAVVEADETPEQEPCVETAGLPDITPPSPGRPRVPWWPFEIYAIAWLALIAYTVVGLPHENDSAPAVLQDVYPAVLLAAVVLTAAGPVMSLFTWLGAWLSNGRRGPGLLTASLIRGALFTLVGVLSWWGTLTLVDAVRLGLVR
ncbi:MAG: hypothetical protein OEV43_06225 [Coriobacteriia bacterium]|nr:hypothetical protein [Coriobacteriia bacterium]